MASKSELPGEILATRLLHWSRQVGLARKLALLLALAAMASGIATYLSLTGAKPLVPHPDLVRVLLLADLVLVLLLLAVVVRRLVRLWSERRSGAAGSELHTRLVALFSVIAVTPAIIVAVFSVLFFNLGLQAWFSTRVSTAVQESVAVAEAYINEHRNAIRADVLAMAADLNRDAPELSHDPKLLARAMDAEVQARSLSEAMMFERNGTILARSSLSLLMQFDKVPDWAIEKASQGQVVVLTSDYEDRVRALVRLDNYLGTYLYVGRFIEPKVMDHLVRTRKAAEEYDRLEKERSGMEITFALVFMVISLLVLLAAVSLGLAVATRLVRPISSMIGAAERVREGDLSARVDEHLPDDEIGRLGRAFNRMTMQLESQRRELVEANRQLDERRRFTETVLSGVSAGVIGLGADGCITLPNPSAIRLLQTPSEQLVGHALEDAVPEMASLLAEARARPDRPVYRQVNIVRSGRPRNLMVSVAAEHSGEQTRGFVVTFDDVTDLVSAQRTAAWADIARRIAHEIKNPLTPIQLSAERLKRKYLREITSDPEVFTKCTDTIIRQVGDIGRMVDEFSAFARMPAPQFRTENLCELVRQGIFLQQVAHPDYEYQARLPEAPLALRCDARQIAQVLTNLLQNAADAIEGRRPDDAAAKGWIAVMVADRGGEVVVEVMDNGRGLPTEQRERLVEPYMTTRTKGTGLGLAIVKKIMEEHGGDLALEDRPGGGALVRLIFRTQPVAAATEGATEPPAAPADAAADAGLMVSGKVGHGA